MKQLELCAMWGLNYLYLGLYIAECDAMIYKARFLPHERLVNGNWVRFDRLADKSLILQGRQERDAGQKRHAAKSGK
jgi:arginyl-tRNA--protein-N-Asp/Glu arginylyltransferase